MLNTYKVLSNPPPTASSVTPLWVLLAVAVRLLIHTSSKSTSIKLMDDSSISIFSRINEPAVLPG